MIRFKNVGYDKNGQKLIKRIETLRNWIKEDQEELEECEEELKKWGRVPELKKVITQRINFINEYIKQYEEQIEKISIEMGISI